MYASLRVQIWKKDLSARESGDSGFVVLVGSGGEEVVIESGGRWEGKEDEGWEREDWG